MIGKPQHLLGLSYWLKYDNERDGMHYLVVVF